MDSSNKEHFNTSLEDHFKQLNYQEKVKKENVAQ